MITAQQMAQILALVETFHPRRGSGKDERRLTLGAWLALFKEEPFELLYRAFAIALKEHEFEPKPAHIEKILLRLKQPKRSLPAFEAWSRLVDYAKQSYSEEQILVLLSELPAAKRAVKAVGWNRIRYADLSSMDFLRKDFCLYYDRATVRRDEKVRELKALPKLNQLVEDTTKKLEAKAC